MRSPTTGCTSHLPHRTRKKVHLADSISIFIHRPQTNTGPPRTARGRPEPPRRHERWGVEVLRDRRVSESVREAPAIMGSELRGRAPRSWRSSGPSFGRSGAATATATAPATVRHGATGSVGTDVSEGTRPAHGARPSACGLQELKLVLKEGHEPLTLDDEISSVMPRHASRPVSTGHWRFGILLRGFLRSPCGMPALFQSFLRTGAFYHGSVGYQGSS